VLQRRQTPGPTTEARPRRRPNSVGIWKYWSPALGPRVAEAGCRRRERTPGGGAGAVAGQAGGQIAPL